MVKGFTACPMDTIFFTHIESNTRGHSWKLLMKKTSQHDTRLYFFSQRSVNRWNNLTQVEVDMPSVNAFKNTLEKRRLHQMDFFMD